MATESHIRSGLALRVAALAAALAAAPALLATRSTEHVSPPLDSDEIGLMGNAGHVPDSKKPKVTAYFTRESYRPGDRAQLIVADASHHHLQILRAGGESASTIPNDVMLGTPVTQRTATHGRTLSIRMGKWPSGVYFARLTAPGSRVGYAPFVLAPRRLGEHRVAVVMPTQTWQAYNFRDDNGDGHPDTWYAGWKTHTARLIRPFLNRGVPPHWKQYDAPFVRWLTQTHRNVDYLSDADLRAVRSGDALADAYTLIVFSGHHEYVTSHEYDVVTRYRDLGGNLAFLAANNFFWKITIKNNVMTRVAQWRDLGRPEAALIGVQYRGNDRGGHRGAWIVGGGASATPWLFDRMDVATGDGVGRGGIEIDATSSASPKNVHVLAEIPDLYGPGFTAQMTYYETAAGAKVFAAGAFTLAGSVSEPEMGHLMNNLWDRLTIP
jgi:N,N-dimethylformamidase beta subunit-like protein